MKKRKVLEVEVEDERVSIFGWIAYRQDTDWYLEFDNKVGKIRSGELVEDVGALILETRDENRISDIDHLVIDPCGAAYLYAGAVITKDDFVRAKILDDSVILKNIKFKSSSVCCNLNLVIDNLMEPGFALLDKKQQVI